MYLLPFRTLLLAALFIVLSIKSVLAVATLSVTPSGDSSYIVQGNGMDGVAGIQLDIAYDAASLTNPTVTQGGLVAGAMLAANTSLPGHIKIAIISTRPFSGSGAIASISFASKKGSGGITSVTTSMIDGTGSAIASSTANPTSETAAPEVITTPGIPFSQTSQQDLSSTQQQSSSVIATASTGTTTMPTYLGTVTLPTEQQQRADVQPATSMTVPVSSEEPAATKAVEQSQPANKPASEAKPEETPQYIVYKGIIDRFRQHKGNNNLSTMAGLFDKKITTSIHQEPAVLLSDGQSKATVTADIPVRITSSPNFAVNGGVLVSFKQNKLSKGRWIVEVLPEAGASRVNLTIIAGVEEFEFPLTVAPPLNTGVSLDESGWIRFMKDVGTTEAPMHDFNNDGTRDYVDEFIFVANYLARKSAPVKSATPPK